MTSAQHLWQIISSWTIWAKSELTKALEFTGTCTVERSSINIAQKDDEYADQEPGKYDRDQNNRAED